MQRPRGCLGPRARGADERGALPLVGARREGLLELINREHEAAVVADARARAVELALRVLAGPDEHLLPLLAARQHAARQRRQQAGAKHRGLAASRRSDDRQQRRADEPRDELRDEPLAAEEVLRVVGPEGRQALERAHHCGLVVGEQRGALARPLQVDDAVGQLSLHRAQLDAADRGARGDGADPACRLAPRPLAGDLMDASRHAAAGLEQPSAGGTASACAGHRRGRSPRRRRRRGARARARRRRRETQRLWALRGREQEHREAGDGAGQVLELCTHVRAGPVGVIDDQQRRARPLVRTAQRRDDRIGGSRPGCVVRHRRPPGGPRWPTRPPVGSCRSRAGR